MLALLNLYSGHRLKIFRSPYHKQAFQRVWFLRFPFHLIAFGSSAMPSQSLRVVLVVGALTLGTVRRTAPLTLM